MKDLRRDRSSILLSDLFSCYLLTVKTSVAQSPGFSICDQWRIPSHCSKSSTVYTRFSTFPHELVVLLQYISAIAYSLIFSISHTSVGAAAARSGERKAADVNPSEPGMNATAGRAKACTSCRQVKVRASDLSIVA